MGSKVGFIQLAPEKPLLHGDRLSQLWGQTQGHMGLRTSLAHAEGEEGKARWNESSVEVLAQVFTIRVTKLTDPEFHMHKY